MVQCQGTVALENQQSQQVTSILVLWLTYVSESQYASLHCSFARYTTKTVWPYAALFGWHCDGGQALFHQSSCAAVLLRLTFTHLKMIVKLLKCIIMDAPSCHVHTAPLLFFGLRHLVKTCASCPILASSFASILSAKEEGSCMG